MSAPQVQDPTAANSTRKWRDAIRTLHARITAADPNRDEREAAFARFQQAERVFFDLPKGAPPDERTAASRERAEAEAALKRAFDALATYRINLEKRFQRAMEPIERALMPRQAARLHNPLPEATRLQALEQLSAARRAWAKAPKEQQPFAARELKKAHQALEQVTRDHPPCGCAFCFVMREYERLERTTEAPTTRNYGSAARYNGEDVLVPTTRGGTGTAASREGGMDALLRIEKRIAQHCRRRPGDDYSALESLLEEMEIDTSDLDDEDEVDTNVLAASEASDVQA